MEKPFCIVVDGDGVVDVHRSEVTNPKIGDSDTVIPNAAVIDVIGPDTPEGQLCNLLMTHDKMDRAERGAEGYPRMRALGKLIAIGRNSK